MHVEKQSKIYEIARILILEKREALNLTQEELAHRAGVCKNTISNIETGRTKPSLETFIKISNALEFNVIEIGQFC